IKAGETDCIGITNECTDMSTCNSGTCTCIANYYDSGDTCVARIKAGETGCTGVIPNECTDMSTCNSGTCTCIANYYDGGDTCVAKLAISVVCDSALIGVSQCSDTNAECTDDNYCRCKAGYYNNNGFTASSSCLSMSTLKVTSVSVTPGTDVVNVTWTPPQNINQVSGYQVIWRLGQSISGSSSTFDKTLTFATITGFTSGATYTFNVKTFETGSRTASQEVESDFSQTVSMKAALSVACGTGSPTVVCEDTTTASCISNTCRCNENYFDSNGFSTPGGVCTSMSTLKVTSVSVTPGTDVVNVTWTPPQNINQVSGYQVIWRLGQSISGSSSTFDKTLTFATITGFTSGATYTFNVKTFETGSRTASQEVESDFSQTVSMKAALSVACGTGSPTVVCEDTTTASCISNTCRCNENYFDSNGFSTPGGVCTSMSTLKVTSVSVTPGTDVVNVTWTPPQNINQVSGYQVIWRLGQSISGSSSTFDKTLTFATITGFTSGATYTFNVKTFETGSRTASQEVESDFSQTVSMKAALSVACGTGSPTVVCEDTTTASCISNTCRCNENYFDSNGFSTPGGVCTSMSTLKVTSVSVTPGTDVVNVTWTPPQNINQVSGYQVIWRLGQSISGSSSTFDKTLTFATITGFTSGATYTFNVKTFETGSRTASQEVESDFSQTVSMKAALSVACGTGSPTVVCEDTTTASCISNTCRCNENYFDSNGFSTPGGVCTSMSTLKVTSVSVTPGTDVVNVTWTPPQNINQVSGYQVIWRLGQSISGSSSTFDKTLTFATITGFTSGATYTFNVKTFETGSRTASQEVESDFSQTVSMKAALSVACGTGSPTVVCEDTTTASCISNTCRCNENYFDSNGFSTPGGVCTSMSTLKVTSVSVTPGTDVVNVTWTPPQNINQVSGYQVIWRLGQSISGSSSTFDKTLTFATITGFTSGATYTFNVKTFETGSRTASQEVESDFSQTVSMKAALSVACGTGSPTVVCEDTTTASCISNTCRCNENYFDSNGFSTPGGVCTSMNALKVTAVTSSSVTTTEVNISWTESSFSSQVSGYVVIWKLSTSTAEVKRSPVVTGTSTTITGLTQSTAYTFNVISQETGSRAATQEIESDASVIVTTKAELSQSCGAILCGDTNSECIAGNSAGNVCRCVSGYYDSNGYSAVGGVCTA
ncbi:uncharacterized protein LOC132563852, partial [Ylistrum balloti]|uniref:uncharacterized protein LOC132563852 n=1 Tax=Ylistrum balloti TaxID=509963 RepID=UPI0029059287